jgi:hypothetical protein
MPPSKETRRESKRKRQERFLAAYGQCPSITRAAKVAQIAFKTHYDWMKKDPTYPARFAEAEKIATQNMIGVAYDRALAMSDRLMILFLNARAPEQFADAQRIYMESRHYHKHTGQVELKPVASEKPHIPVEDMPLELQRQLLDWMRQRKTEQEARQLPGPEMKEVVDAKQAIGSGKRAPGATDGVSGEPESESAG